jgi:hypothetical protein
MSRCRWKSYTEHVFANGKWISVTFEVNTETGEVELRAFDNDTNTETALYKGNVAEES